MESVNKLPNELVGSVFESCNAKDIDQLLKVSRGTRGIVDGFPERWTQHDHADVTNDLYIKIMDAVEIRRLSQVEEMANGVLLHTETSSRLEKKEWLDNSPGLRFVGSRMYFCVPLLDRENVELLKAFRFCGNTISINIGSVEVSDSEFRSLLENMDPANLELSGDFDRRLLTDDMFFGMEHLHKLIIRGDPAQQDSRITTKLCEKLTERLPSVLKLVLSHCQIDVECFKVLLERCFPSKGHFGRRVHIVIQNVKREKLEEINREFRMILANFKQSFSAIDLWEEISAVEETKHSGHQWSVGIHQLGRFLKLQFYSPTKMMETFRFDEKKGTNQQKVPLFDYTPAPEWATCDLSDDWFSAADFNSMDLTSDCSNEGNESASDNQ